jgi:Xaa-Pro aminopeptidase
MRKPTENVEIFKKRRQKAIAKLGGNALIVGAHPELIRNDDVHYRHRQDSNIYYLTGFEEPESIVMLLPGKNPQEVLFVRRKNPERETWDGFRYGPAAAQTEFKFDQVYPIDEFSERAPELLKGFDGIYYRVRKNPELDEKVFGVVESLKSHYGRSGLGLVNILDADEFMGQMRVVKGEEEIQNMRMACEISAQGHLSAMKKIRPGMTERQIEAILQYEFLNRGAAREGYTAIVASGNAATTLHYNFNDQPCRDGDLLLIDAGAEFHYYSGDITRTFPVNGRFTKPQLEVYNHVLDVQKKITDMTKPGVPLRKLHEVAAELLTDAMLDLGLLSGKRSDLISANQHRKYYPHGLGHYLGLDVHDAGKYVKSMSASEELLPLEAGMTFTIEPGLYIPANDTSAPAELRGIGVRIEDDVLVTATGCEVMTKSAPKEVADLEKIVGKG